MATKFLWLLISGLMLCSCININVGEEAKEAKKTKKVRASYRSNKFHKSKKYYHKVDDVYSNNKGKESSSTQYKKQQASALKNLNKNKRSSNNTNKTDTSFELY